MQSGVYYETRGLREFDEDLMMEEEDGLARIRNIKELSNFCKIILKDVQH